MNKEVSHLLSYAQKVLIEYSKLILKLFPKFQE